MMKTPTHQSPLPKSSDTVKRIKRAVKHKKNSASVSKKVPSVSPDKIEKKKSAGTSHVPGEVPKKKRKKKKSLAIKTKLPAPAHKPPQIEKEQTAPTERSSPEKLGIVTRAGIRRCATRVGIRCIQRATVTELRDVVEGLVEELLMRARSNAYNISKTKTLRMVDVASAARNMGLGDVIV